MATSLTSNSPIAATIVGSVIVIRLVRNWRTKAGRSPAAAEADRTGKAAIANAAPIRLTGTLGKVWAKRTAVTEPGPGRKAAGLYPAMDHPLGNGLDILTLGQYLQPTKRHLDVAEFSTPDQFAHYKEEGLRRGLKYVESGPLVRSSYHAERHVNVPI